MNALLDGRVIIVTGAARGIGQAYARGLAAAGATVVAADILDCSDTAKAHLCATLGDSKQHFCTFACHDPDAGADADAGPAPANECGENATCQCQGGQCGCFPDFCK